MHPDVGPTRAPIVARLRVYPFKSLDGVDVDAAAFTERGGLLLDRAFALFDADGGYVNAKREPRVHHLRVTYDPSLTSATFALPDGERFAFAFADAPDALAAFLSRYVGRDVAVRRDDDGGFPDDPKAPGPTIVSFETLAAVASWFDGMTIEDVRLRLRANIELDGVPAFWEDRLFGPAGELVGFRIGDVLLGGTNPCARCVVPTRDARTGEPLPAFAKRVAERRAASLPAWADATRFDHFYRLCVNTRTIEARGRQIRVGDELLTAEEPRAVR
jgi:uncharacterized protein YcbX